VLVLYKQLGVVKVPLLVHRQVSPLLQDAHVFARQRPASEGIVWPVFGTVRVLGGGCVALEVCEGTSAAAVLALHGLLVPMREVGIAAGLHLSVAVGLDLDALDARALVVVVFALDRHVVHYLVGVVT
jgi:hypothetical protein